MVFQVQSFHRCVESLLLTSEGAWRRVGAHEMKAVSQRAETPELLGAGWGGGGWGSGVILLKFRSSHLNVAIYQFPDLCAHGH